MTLRNRSIALSGALARFAADARVRRAVAAAAVIVAVFGALFAFGLAGRSSVELGPVTVGVQLTPSLDGSTTLQFRPFGRVSADTHAGPVALVASLDEVDVDAVQRMAMSGLPPREQLDSWVADLRGTVRQAAVTGAIAALLASAAIAWTLTHSWRHTLVAVVLALAVPAVALGLGVSTFDARAFAEPTFEGALTYAPAAFNLVQQKVTDIRGLQQQARALAADLSAYYGTTQSIAPGGTLPGTYRVLHVSDLHLDPVGMQLAIDLARAYDVALVIDTGDISYFGSDAEGALAALQLSSRPYIFVPGNHDSPAVLANLETNGNVDVLSGETTTTATGLTVLGVGDPVGESSGFEPDADASLERGQEAVRARLRAHVVAVHNPLSGRAFEGKAGVVLSGHTHTPSLEIEGDTVFLNAGTTGGVHFSDLTSDPHIPHSANILYFSLADPSRLVAVDQIEVYGKTRQSSIRRTVIDEGFLTAE
jgi:predicted phosphodiesterase